VETPEESHYPSVEHRIVAQDPKLVSGDQSVLRKNLRAAIGRLVCFAEQATDDVERAIPYQIRDYLELVDWSGRAIIEGKRGSIPDNLPPILKRLKIDPDNCIRFMNQTMSTVSTASSGPSTRCEAWQANSGEPS